jgi:hypothetical protein
MRDIDIPFTNHDVDPSDPGGSAKSLGFAAIGFMLLFAVVSVATLGYNRVLEFLGADQPQVPGV